MDEEVIDLLEDFSDREFDEEEQEDEEPELDEADLQEIDEMDEPEQEEYEPEPYVPPKPAGKIPLSSADLLASPERPKRKIPTNSASGNRQGKIPLNLLASPEKAPRRPGNATGPRKQGKILSSADLLASPERPKKRTISQKPVKKPDDHLAKQIFEVEKKEPPRKKILLNSDDLLASPEKPKKVARRTVLPPGTSPAQKKKILTSAQLLESPEKVQKRMPPPPPGSQKKKILNSAELMASPEKVQKRPGPPPPGSKKRKILSSEDLLASPEKPTGSVLRGTGQSANQQVKMIQRKKMDINLSFKELTERNKVVEKPASPEEEEEEDERMPIEVTIAKSKKPAKPAQPAQRKIPLTSSQLIDSPKKPIPVLKKKVANHSKKLSFPGPEEQIEVVDSDEERTEQKKLPIEVTIRNKPAAEDDGPDSEDELYDVKERVENLQDDLQEMWGLLQKLTAFALDVTRKTTDPDIRKHAKSIFKEAAMFENVCPRASWEKMKRSVEDPVPFFGTNVDKCCQTGEEPRKKTSSKLNNRKVKNQDFLSLMYPVD
ncbi:Oidioi.mRNA.OKI2018_I69.PAR.g10574.t1.cds [Oikopleura dioica]|uniref:Oidioi.mRNA.OKI2018_I69.PAR.g10574.t1.cds n=1 Tax=Oikopleura dioica TaxID=34765 RepID=A0ABN7RVJ2_OIKDI|nr:Oidioi.mRNA.OKI2018_I69.PAR.g10574.t1.cds [Oikopleura dioica]